MAGGNDPPAPRPRSIEKDELIIYKISKRRKHEHTSEAGSPPQSIMSVRSICGYSLSKFKLKTEIDQLEKERRQCMHRLKEDQHMFKMSVKLPLKYAGLEYWSQYGEKFHANGEYREEAVAVRVPYPIKNRRLDMTTEAREVRRKSSCKKREHKTPLPKTVSDLIAAMRGHTTAESAEGKSLGQPAHTSSRDDVLKSMIEATMSDNVGAHRDKLERLRHLLENYEVFVPIDSKNAFHESYSEESVEEFVTHREVCFDEELQKGMGVSNIQESKSVSVVRDDGSGDEERYGAIRCVSAKETTSTTSRKKSSSKDPKWSNLNPCESIADNTVNSIRPHVRRIAFFPPDSSKEELGLFWRSPSRRIARHDSSLQHLHKTSVDHGYSVSSVGSETLRNLRKELGERIIQADSTCMVTCSESHVSPANSCCSTQTSGPAATSNTPMNKVPLLERFQDFNLEPNLRSKLGKSTTDGHFICTAKEHKLSSSSAKNEQPETDDLNEEIVSNMKKSLNVPETRLGRHKGRRSSSRHTARRPNPDPAHLKHTTGSPVKVAYKTIHPEFVGISKTGKRKGRVTSYSATAAAQKRNPCESKRNGPRSVSAPCPDTRRVTCMMVKGTALHQDVKDQKEKETRAKMDQFFARLDITAQQRPPRSRNRARTGTFTRTEKDKKPEDKKKREKKYHRAAPWPVEVWC